MVLPFGKQKNVDAFYQPDKKDLSDSVERLKTYWRLRLTCPTVRRSCHLILQLDGGLEVKGEGQLECAMSYLKSHQFRLQLWFVSD